VPVARNEPVAKIKRLPHRGDEREDVQGVRRDAFTESETVDVSPADDRAVGQEKQDIPRDITGTGVDAGGDPGRLERGRADTHGTKTVREARRECPADSARIIVENPAACGRVPAGSRADAHSVIVMMTPAGGFGRRTGLPAAGGVRGGDGRVGSTTAPAELTVPTVTISPRREAASGAAEGVWTGTTANETTCEALTAC